MKFIGKCMNPHETSQDIRFFKFDTLFSRSSCPYMNEIHPTIKRNLPLPHLLYRDIQTSRRLFKISRTPTLRHHMTVEVISHIREVNDFVRGTLCVDSCRVAGGQEGELCIWQVSLDDVQQFEALVSIELEPGAEGFLLAMTVTGEVDPAVLR